MGKKLSSYETQGFQVKELVSQFWGRCFTTQSDQRFMPKEHVELLLNPEFPHKLLVFFHEPGEEFWLISDYSPYQLGRGANLATLTICPLVKKVCGDS